MARIHDAVLTVASLGLIVAGLAAFNSDARRHVANIFAGNTGDLAVIVAPVNQAVRVTMQTLNDYQSDSGPMFAFAAVAVVLFGLMFKA